MSEPPQPGWDVAVSVMDEAWLNLLPDAEGLARRCAAAALENAGEGPAELSVALADDSAVHALNRRYRHQDKATNVLSFPAGEVVPPGGPRLLGDVMLARETVTREAGEQDKPLEAHFAHLVVHGVLHLLGRDHEEEAEAEAMENEERLVLAALGYPDPYGEERA